MPYFVYILFSERTQKYYCGITENVAKRLGEHNRGKGNFTAKGVPWKLVKEFEIHLKQDALKIELQIKKRGIKRFLQDLA